MKTHKTIIIVSLSLCIIFLLIIFLFDPGELLCDILLSIIASMLVSFILEIPHAIIYRNMEYKKLYNSLFWIKVKLYNINNEIIKQLNNNPNINNNILDNNIKEITNIVNNVNLIDEYIFLSSDNRKLFNDKIKKLNNQVFNLQKNYNLLLINYYESQLTQNNYEINSINDLEKIKKLTKSTTNLINNIVSSFYNNKTKKEWNKEEKIIKSSINKFNN